MLVDCVLLIYFYFALQCFAQDVNFLMQCFYVMQRKLLYKYFLYI